MLNCSNLAEIVTALPLVEECAALRDGTLRISTPFTYPNGEHIDVFLSETRDIFRDLRLSDYGQTTHYLRTAQAKLGGTRRKREILADITAQTGVRFASGDLYIESVDRNLAALPDFIFRLSQACVRVSDFGTHQRLRSSNPFRDDVEDFLEARHLVCIPDVSVQGKYGSVSLDYEVRFGKGSAYLLVLAALNESSAHNSANEIFSKWHNILHGEANSFAKRVTVYNSQSNAIRGEDLDRLRDYSNVVSYPQEQDLLASLLAA